MKARLCAIALLTSLCVAAHADFNDGVVALTMGDYEKALTIFLPLAETADHAYAQYFVGRMFAAGQGVEKNSEIAAKWYRKSAKLGVADAQFRLADQYAGGDGVPRDLESAFAWYRVAAHLGNEKAAAAISETAEQLSAAELNQAKRFAGELIERFGTTPKSTARTQ